MSQPRPSCTPNSIQVFGSTCSMLVRGTVPVVKAWSSTRIGASDSTASMFSARRRRRSSGESSVKLPSDLRLRTITEIVLATCVKAKVLAHAWALRFKETDQTPEVIVVAMANYQRIHLRHIICISSRLLI